MFDDAKLESKKVIEIAEGRKYDRRFFHSLYGLERKVKEHKPISDAYHFLQHGKDLKQDLGYSKSFFEDLSRAIQSETFNQISYKEENAKKRKRKR